MKELFSLQSFQKVLFFLFFIGFFIGIFYGIYILSNRLKFYSIIPLIPALFFIAKGLYKNIPLLINDCQSIYAKR
jgi:hypothetical protein